MNKRDSNVDKVRGLCQIGKHLEGSALPREAVLRLYQSTHSSVVVRCDARGVVNG